MFKLWRVNLLDFVLLAREGIRTTLDNTDIILALQVGEGGVRTNLDNTDTIQYSR